MDLLNNPLPVLVTSKNNAKGYAIDVEGNDWVNAKWCVVMETTGEIWGVPNDEIRVRSNWTMKVNRL